MVYESVDDEVVAMRVSLVALYRVYWVISNPPISVGGVHVSVIELSDTEVEVMRGAFVAVPGVTVMVFDGSDSPIRFVAVT